MVSAPHALKAIRRVRRSDFRTVGGIDMPPIRFCASPDGTRLAYTDEGIGPVIVKAGNSFSHLSQERSSPVWGPWLEEIGRDRRMIRYDMRGWGLSDRGCPDWSSERLVADLETVVDNAGLDRFALYGFSSAVAVCVAYAARHPERVTHLVLQSGAARGRRHRELAARDEEVNETIANLIRFSMSGREPFSGLFARMFIPDSTPEHLAWLRKLEPTEPTDALGIMKVIWESNVVEEAQRVRCPTLVLNSTRNELTPFDESRLLAGLIPDAELVGLDSRNHLVLSHEPAWQRWVEAVRAFLPAEPTWPGPLTALSPREGELLGLVAQGLDNLQIAAHLALREKTVRNMVSRLYTKLGVEGRAQAIVLAREAGFGR